MAKILPYKMFKRMSVSYKRKPVETYFGILPPGVLDLVVDLITPIDMNNLRKVYTPLVPYLNSQVFLTQLSSYYHLNLATSFKMVLHEYKYSVTKKCYNAIWRDDLAAVSHFTSLDKCNNWMCLVESVRADNPDCYWCIRLGLPVTNDEKLKLLGIAAKGASFKTLALIESDMATTIPNYKQVIALYLRLDKVGL
jgi:hypothetical protein